MYILLSYYDKTLHCQIMLFLCKAPLLHLSGMLHIPPYMKESALAIRCGWRSQVGSKGMAS